MDFDYDDDQQAILDAVGSLLEQYAGPARAIELQAKDEYDGELHAALEEAGFTEVARDEATGPLEAALVVEAVAKAGGIVAAGAQTLVTPALCPDPVAGPIALMSTAYPGPVRFGAQAQSLLLLDGDDARLVELGSGDFAPVRSNFGYPMGVPSGSLEGRGRSLGPGSGERLETWWRLALAVEAVGTMDAALAQTVGYLKQRKQFGRAIGSFQAVQHRLAECAIHVEGSRWLVREAAGHGAPAEPVATAAAFALAAARRIFSETHQLSGAIGFTREHDLHVWSMRLHALRLELGGVSAHRRAVVTARWRPGSGRNAP